MKRSRFFSLLLILSLVSALCVSPACASSDAALQTVSFPATGVEIDLPADIDGLLYITRDLKMDTFARGAELWYFSVPQEERGIFSKPLASFKKEDNALIDGKSVSLLQLFCVENGKTIDDIHPELQEAYETEHFQVLGTAGDCTFYVRYLPEGFEFASRLSAEARAEAEALVEFCKQPDRLRLFQPKDADSVLLTFETVDLDGQPVRSEDLFGSHTLTMLNAWGTGCGPCLEELWELDYLSRKMEEKNVAVVGVVLNIQDPEDSRTIADAKEVLAWKDAHYLNLVPWDGFVDMLPVYGLPTTFFIDSNGQTVGEAETGYKNSAAYTVIINKILARMSKGE